MNIYDQIKTMSDEMAGDLTAQRRDFHKYAEPGWFEMRTSSIIARKLTELGYEVLVGDQVCKKDSRMGVPSEEKLEEQYERAVAQGADPEFVKYTKGGMTGVIGILRCGEGPDHAPRIRRGHRYQTAWQPSGPRRSAGFRSHRSFLPLCT